MFDSRSMLQWTAWFFRLEKNKLFQSCQESLLSLSGNSGQRRPIRNNFSFIGLIKNTLWLEAQPPPVSCSPGFSSQRLFSSYFWEALSNLMLYLYLLVSIWHDLSPAYDGLWQTWSSQEKNNIESSARLQDTLSILIGKWMHGRNFNYECYISQFSPQIVGFQTCFICFIEG